MKDGVTRREQLTVVGDNRKALIEWTEAVDGDGVDLPVVHDNSSVEL